MQKETYTHLFSHLETLSALKLHALASELLLKEKVASATIIAHLAEICRQKAHLELGYKNLFDYCVRGLGLCEGSAHLKIQIAYKVRALPLVLEYLSENRISLSVAGLLAPILNPKNVELHLKACERMTKRQVEVYLTAFRPREPWNSGIRKQASRKPVAATAPNDKPATKVEPATPEIFNFRFSGSKTFKEKLERYAEVLGIRSPHKNLSDIFERAIDAALEKKDPRKKLERKLRRQAKLKEKAEREKEDTVPPTQEAPSPAPPRPDEVANIFKAIESPPASVTQAISDPPPASRPTISRYIPKPTRDLVLERAGYQCEFRSSSGTRCPERCGLAIDHIQPFAMNGGHQPENLRALCKNHNLWKAERDFGREHIRRKTAKWS